MIFTARITWGVAYASVGTFAIILSTPIKENNNGKKINSNSNKTRYNNNNNNKYVRLSVTSIVRDSDNLHFSSKQSANWQENNGNNENSKNDKNDNNNSINNVNNVNQ